MVKKYNGDSCKNARIKIDYNGLKPKVNFSYPDKKNQETSSMFPTIMGIWFLIFCFVFIGYSFALEEDEEVIDLSNYGVCNSYYINKSIETCEFREGKTDFDLLVYGFKTDWNLEYLFFLLILIGPPFLIYFPFRTYWANVFPKHQARGLLGKLVIFKSKDIKKEGKKYFVEIPLFKNILLEYEAKKDFSKYLSYFEIREYNFKYIKGKTIKKAMKSKKSVNEYLWYARFYFKKKPIDGKLVVLFR